MAVPREEYLFGRVEIAKFLGYDSAMASTGGVLTKLIYIHGCPVRRMGAAKCGRLVARKSELLEWLESAELIQEVKFKLNL